MALLKKNKHPHPLVYMRGVRSDNLIAIMNFLYIDIYGEANVHHDNVDTFRTLAEELRLKGLSEGAGADNKSYNENQQT